MLTRKSVRVKHTVSLGNSRRTSSHTSIHQPVFHITRITPLSSQKWRRKRPTLNGSLGTDRGSQTHGAGHEVREDLVGARGRAGRVFAEVGDLHSRATLVGAGEGALERSLRIGDSPPLLAGGNGGAGGGQLLASARTQQSAGGGGERHGDGGQLTSRGVDRNCVEGWREKREWMKSEVEVEVGSQSFR